MKIGLFGGTFNPPHIGHINAAKIFVREISPDLLYIMPSAVPPHKEISFGDEPARRFEMAKKAFGFLPCDTVFSALELARDGKSYTIDTVNEILSVHGKDCGKIYLYVGSDMLFYFEKWKSFRELFEKCIIVTAPRDNDELSEMKECCERFRSGYGAEIILLPIEPVVVSSTLVRETKNPVELKKYLTDDIVGYIIKNDMYGNIKGRDITTEKELFSIRTSLGKYISPERLSHTVGVSKTAERMAEIFLPLCGYDEEYLPDITAAAYLHDITKCRDDAWHESFLSDYMRGYHGYNAVYHSWSGAYFALTEYHCNPRVFRSVYSHTTGRADMDIFEKIIFLADYIEPGRTHPACRALREKYLSLCTEKENSTLLRGLDMLIIESMENTYSHLEKKKAPIHASMLHALDFLKKEVKK